MGWTDLGWEYKKIKPKQEAEIGQLLEPGESLVNVGIWTSMTALNIWMTQTNNVKYEPSFSDFANAIENAFWVLALTDENLYLAKWSTGFWGMGGGSRESTSRPMTRFSEWNFVRHMDKKGRLLGYQFTYAAEQGLEAGDFKAPTVVSEPFKEQFERIVAQNDVRKSTVDVAGQLSAMHQLWTEGVLSDTEFERSKELFLGRTPDQQQVAEKSLRSLQQLKDSGVLNEAEFAAKKWEILST